MSKSFINWFFFGLLSVIWGSSFILMKIGLENKLTAYQVASLRIVAAGIILLPFAIRYIRAIPPNKILLVFLSGVLGSLLPAYLFCISEEEIDSSLAGTLNCLTPVFVIITGALFFKVTPPSSKIVGILIAFAGSVLLLFSKGQMQESRHLLYVSFVILATFLYGFNVNMVTRHLLQISSFHIAAVALVLNAVPALIVLICTGYFRLPLSEHNFLLATGAASLLGVLGTAVATIIFYMLVKRAGGIFATMVTYGIPFVAIAWGIYYNEAFGLRQLACLLIILFGVYWVNRKPSRQVVDDNLA
ncbi:MAG: DMT family transporter [Ferruginibacter sp.]